MGKQGKSSATSATRKKHQKKAANALDPSISIAPQAQPKGKGKGKKNKEPRVKKYIPPPKFKPLAADPIEKLATTGLLPPNMVLGFRGLSKRDPVTKTKALEDLSNMLEDEAWPAALPVWLWHFVPLSVHPNRRVRELNAFIHAKLVARQELRDELHAFILNRPDSGSLLAAWALGASDIVPPIATSLRLSWNSTVSWKQEPIQEGLLNIEDQLEDLVSSIIQATIEPDVLYQQFAPLATASKDGTDKAEALNAHEQPQDRDARLRTSGLGAIGWIVEHGPSFALSQLVPLLTELCSSDPWFASVLSSQESPAFLSGYSLQGDATKASFGYEQRTVRIAAWGAVAALVKYLRHCSQSSGESLKSAFISSLGIAALQSAWVEPDPGVRTSMWEALLPLITTFPKVWTTNSSLFNPVGGQADDSESESETEGTSDEHATLPGQIAYLEFLNFLQLGCLGSGIQSYPTVYIVLSTIPPGILPYDQNNLDRFFNSLWAAYDGNALSGLPRDRESVLNAFLSAALESAFLVFRKLKGMIEPTGTTTPMPAASLLSGVVATWIGRVVTESVSGTLLSNLSAKTVGELFGSCIMKLEQLDAAVLDQTWISTWKPVLAGDHTLVPQKICSTKLLASTLNHIQTPGVNERRVKELLTQLIRSSDIGDTSSSDLTLQAEILKLIWELLNQPGTWLIEITREIFDNDFVSYLISIGNSQALRILLNGLLSNLSVGDSSRLSIWREFLLLAASRSPSVLVEVLDAAKFVPFAVADNPEFFVICQSWVSQVILGQDEHLRTLEAIMRHWDLCLSRSQFDQITNTLSASFMREAEDLIFAPEYVSHKESITPLARVLLPALQFLDIEISDSTGPLRSARFGAILYVVLALESYLPPNFGALLSVVDLGRRHWVRLTSLETRNDAERGAKALIGKLLNNCQTPLRALDVLDVAYRSGLYASEKDLLAHALPPQKTFELELQNLSDNPSSLLAEADPLLPVTGGNPTGVAFASFDSEGLAKYPRIARGLISVLSQDRQLAKEQLWCFLHLLAFQQLCSDFVSASSWPSDAFKPDSMGVVQVALSGVSQLVIYLENSLFNDLGLAWHEDLAAWLNKPIKDITSPCTASDLVSNIYLRATRNSASLRDVRLLRRVMQMVLRDADASILDIWTGFAQRIQKQYPLPAIAIGSITASRGTESPRLDRWRNELASQIAGVTPSLANSTGISYLRMLNSIAPPIESGIIFLPQQRAVYLIQALQAWMTSDEDLDESLEAYVTITICHVLPILQSVPGAHWEFIFDILESNIVVDGESTSNLYLLLQTLRAIRSVHDLAASNKALQEAWRLRPEGVFDSLLVLFLCTADNGTPSETREKYCSCLVDCMRLLSPAKISSELFDELLSLTRSRDITIKAMAHELVRNTVVQITEQRVIEAAVGTSTGDEMDVQNDQLFELPQSLTSRLNPTSAQDTHENQLNLLLAWWITLEFFDGSSLKVKQGYMEQLRRLDLVKSSLLPSIFELLGIGPVSNKPFDLSQWHIEDFFFDLYDTSLPTAASVLAAHIYYKALKAIPGLIRTWWSECQDKQLASSFATYTKLYFSPILIKQELSQFRSSAASATEALNDDAFSVKVAPSVNEISAVYTVDEQTLEIAVRLAPEFPLKSAEVRDVRGIAGMENKRRAWVFGVQQAAQQGLIYDALSVYKKNAAGHFEGKSECAICYSLISVTDRTLPTKPCRTCKNRFHASCLYKWFNTSHSSTCPLCRSDIF